MDPHGKTGKPRGQGPPAGQGPSSANPPTGNASANKPPAQRLICYCNAIPQEEIENAIRRGCDTLSKIFDATTAGVGACGGSCQPVLRKMLETYQQTGQFPPDPRPQPQRHKVKR